MTNPSQVRISSTLGDVVLLWTLREGTPIVERIVLPREGRPPGSLREGMDDGAPPLEKSGIGGMSLRIRRFLQGEAVPFSLEGLDMGSCGPLQGRVLRETYRIPRGLVLTYGGLARRVGVPRGARAIGTVMARNPFPLVIPCHRVIRSGGSLGGFGGGVEMKRALLEMEGVRFDHRGRVLPAHILR